MGVVIALLDASRHISLDKYTKTGDKTMKKTLLIVVVLFMVLIPVCYGRDAAEITDMLQDGRFNEVGGPAYTRVNNTANPGIDSPAGKGYFEFNLTGSGIPPGASIVATRFWM